ncbi:sugar ABC transporter substrate-binding protein [Marispirochaeta sp.]|uniref:ABC transporter substrate-binding protein n=1 Tax=Marispirochaeta sp. TaxID=2038653 RepID=UPI0029C75BF0|nr:sugar ABC transporter substrate-binding protein [Marispirochaeta sp.]
MKKAFSAMLLGVFLLSTLGLWAAGSAESQEGPVELRVAWWGNPTRDERTLGVIDLYQEKNPGVTIEPETVGWGGYWDRINTQVAGGNLPDVMQHDYAYLFQFVSRNQLADMTPYVNNGTINLSGVDESYLSGGRINGKLYGISLGTNAVALVYDPAVLEKAGIAEPDPDWTMGDFEDLAREIYAKTRVRTLPFFTTDPKVGFENWIRQTGKPLFAPDGSSLGFTDTKPLEEFFKIQVRLIEDGVMIPPEESFVSLSPQEGFLARGGSWCDFMWSNQFIAFQDAANRPLKMTLVPGIEGAKRPGTYLKPSMFFAIPATSEKKDEAAKFINFFLTDPEANKILLGERGVPIIPTVREVVKSVVGSQMQIIFDYITLVGDGNASPIDPPDPAASGEFLKMFRDVTQEVLMGAITPQAGAQKVMTSAGNILSR